MKYSRFEWLALVVGGVAIIGTIFASLHGQPMIEEIVAQVLLMVVLFAAVHWGRNGGFLAAVAAIVVYVAMRSPLLVHEGLTRDLLDLVLVRMAAYGVVGIIGGEVCGRIKYLAARLEGGINIDAETTLYNQAYVANLVSTYLAQSARYKSPFSIALLKLAPALTSELKPTRRRSLLRAVANHVRNDVRLVDDVGRLADGTFVLIFPQTSKSGGEVAASRVREGVRELLGAKVGSVETRVLSTPEDHTELNSFLESIREAAQAAA